MTALIGRAQSSLPSAPGQLTAAEQAEEERLAPREAAKRDALMAPGLDDLTHGSYAAAYEKLHTVAVLYPDDLSVLRPAAAAAMGSGHNQEALEIFRHALLQRPHQPWPIRQAIMILEARLDLWSDFDRDAAALRVAKRNGMDHGLDGSSGFVIDEFDSIIGKVQAVIYPLQGGRYHTLYRFLLPDEAAIKPSTQASSSSSGPCRSADFQPSMDVESDEADQAAFAKAHPDKAAKGERSYFLDSHLAPCTQALTAFYPDGEPTYEKVRADVVRALAAPPKR